MWLKEWLLKNEMTIKALANVVSVTREHLSEVINGKSRAGPKLAKRIEEYTKGAIKSKDIALKRKIKKKE